MDAVDDTTHNMAVDWIDSLSTGCLWNVQLLQKKYRVNRKTGKRREVPFRIHRYAEGCPPSCMKAAMDYLLSIAPYSGIVFRGEELPGKYRPTKTEWLYDLGGAQNPMGRSSDGTFTLHQDLIDDTESETLPYTSANSCTEEVQSEWHWDEDDIEDLPAPSQGVSWSIRSESRSDDGTLSYVLMKRVAVTSHMEKTIFSDNATGTVYRETWKNLYGEPPHGFKDDTGATVEVPYPENAPAGTTITLQLNKNDDCTYDLVATTEVAKPVNAKVMSSHDQYGANHSLTKDAQDAPLGNAPDATGGFIHAHTDTLRPDGKYTTQETVEVERPVEQARRVEALTRKGRRIVITNRNQPAPATFSDIKLGGAVDVTKTKGRLYDNTITTWDRSVKDKVGVLCHDDLFKHQDRTTTAGYDALPSGHVNGGSGGKVVSRSGDVDDEGAITWTEDVTTEQPVTKSKESWTMGLDGLVHEVVDTQVSTAGTKVTASASNIGKSVTNERTPGGRYNVTKTELTPVDLKGLGLAHDATKFDHTDTETSLVKTEPTGTKMHPTAGDGKYYTTTYELTRTGAYRLSEKVVNELPVSGASVEERRTPRVVITTKVDRNMTKSGGSLTGLGLVKNDITPGGRYNVTTTTATVTGNKDYAACASTVVSHEHQSQTTKLGTTADESCVGKAGNGVHYSKTSRVDDYGVVSTVTTTTTETPYNNFSVSYTRAPKCLIVRSTNKNGKIQASQPVPIGWSTQHSTNPGGSCDLTTETVTVVPEKDAVEESLTKFERRLARQNMPDTGPVTEGSPVSAAGGTVGDGTTYSVSERVDGHGIRTVTVTKTDELQVSNASADVTSTVFARYWTSTDRNTAVSIPANYDSARNPNNTGPLETKKYTMNPGGSVTVETQRTLPVKQTWDDPEINVGKMVHRKTYFRNFTKSEFDSRVNAFVSKAKADLASWDNSNTPASTYSLAPVCRMNDYGLFDGEVSFDAKWSPEAAAPGENVNRYFTDKTFLEYLADVSSRAGQMLITSQARRVRLVAGRGAQYWDNLCGQHSSHMSGSSFRFSPSTGMFEARIVLGINKVTTTVSSSGSFTP